MRNPWERVRNICITLAIYNVSVAVAATVPTSMREGPMAYREACCLQRVSLEELKSPPVFDAHGEYILHHQGHCAGIRIEGGIAHVYDSRQCRSRIFNTIELSGLICNMESFVVFRLHGGSVATSLDSVSMDLRDSAVDSIIRSDAPVWKMDKYQPIREEGRDGVAFAGRLNSELAYAECDLARRRSRTVSANRVKFPLCPFRIFDRKSRVSDRIRHQNSEKAGSPPTNSVCKIAQDFHNGDLARSVFSDDPHQVRCNAAGCFLNEVLGRRTSARDSSGN